MQRVQVGPRDVAQDEVERAVVVARRVHRDDVRVVDGGGHLPLALEARAELRIGRPVGGQELQRDRPPEAELGGPVDHAHAAAADHALDAASRELGSLGQLRHTKSLTGSARAPRAAGVS